MGSLAARGLGSTVNDVLNLQELFGGRFVVRFDPAYDPCHRPGDCLDPWMMTMQSRLGTIFPHGGHRLAVEVEGRPSVRKRLDRLDCCQRYVRGERFATWLFHVRDFEQVAEVVRPAKKRTWTGAERQQAADQLKVNLIRSLERRVDSRFSRAVCVPMGRGDSRAVQAGETRQ
jgi:hypothetical protein